MVYRFDSKVERVQDFSGSRDLAPTAYAIRANGMTTLIDAIVKGADELVSALNTEKRSSSRLMEWTASRARVISRTSALLAVGASIFAVDMAQMDVAGSRKQSGRRLVESIREQDRR